MARKDQRRKRKKKDDQKIPISRINANQISDQAKQKILPAARRRG